MISNLEIDHKSPIPLHKQIEYELRELIKKDRYTDGKMFPKEVDLSNQFGVSRNTVRQAINTLVLEGLLERKKGRGTIVHKERIATQLSKWQSFTQEMSEKGIKTKTYDSQLKTISLNEERAQIFNSTKGKKAQKLIRLRGDEKEPYVYFVSWFHPKIEFNEEENFDLPLYEIMKKEFSINPKRSSEELTAMLADKFLAGKLEIEENTPILQRKRVVYDIGNRPIEINFGYYRADKFSYKIDFEI
ncbi:GntR family transcriptional regulator [Aureibacter tunicatorum]|uniref:GntR family transcriptional regulator n=1 Tax=Aureibacter tunicatorum TaxID=866807 RepID=A0AAE3XJ15_9BACT|nr:GntR family transcriptional regulator [Aureibacter tunicatorum]MDR6237292.1 GntR family transcriptional regulator [Aureibacter tunicatorum]BDD06283.1 transcriptional regulator [Aureibacter tunicatorum]